LFMAHAPLAPRFNSCWRAWFHLRCGMAFLKCARPGERKPTAVAVVAEPPHHLSRRVVRNVVFRVSIGDALQPGNWPDLCHNPLDPPSIDQAFAEGS
jgi:hypothetical protein